MDLNLKGKGALVLASSAGLGKGCATALAQEGARVMLFGRTQERLEAARDEIREATGNEPAFIVGDVRRGEDIATAVQATVDQCGGIYALVTNAGGPPAGGFGAFDDATWESAFELTLMSVVRTIRAALPYMEEGTGGRVVIVASSSTKAALPNLLLSNVFRTGLMGLGKSLAMEYAGKDVFFNVLSPGRFDTDRVAQLDAMRAEKTGKTVEEIRKSTFASIPAGRYGDPLEFGRAAAFLLSPANSYITGQALLVDGGLVPAY